MAIGVAFLGCVAGLIAYESTAESPFLNLSLFKIRLFSCSAVSLLIISTCYTIPFFLLPFYLQNVLLLSPSFIGLLFMVPPIMTVLLAPLSGTIADRFGPRLPASFGILFFFDHIPPARLFFPTEFPLDATRFDDCPGGYHQWIF